MGERKSKLYFLNVSLFIRGQVQNTVNSWVYLSLSLKLFNLNSQEQKTGRSYIQIVLYRLMNSCCHSTLNCFLQWIFLFPGHSPLWDSLNPTLLNTQGIIMHMALYRPYSLLWSSGLAFASSNSTHSSKVLQSLKYHLFSYYLSKTHNVHRLEDKASKQTNNKPQVLGGYRRLN